MSSYDSWLNVLTGMSQGSFDKIFIKDVNGQMVDILTLISGGGGGAVSSATLPLSISNGVLSISLAGYIPTSHEANKVGIANVDFGAFDIRTQTVTFENGSSVTATLSVDNSGALNIGADGVLTVPMLNAWQFQTMAFKDSNATVRNLVPSLSGGLVYNNLQLVDLNILATQMASKQDTLVNLSETTTSTTIVQTYDDATPVSIHLAWSFGNATYLDVANSHQEVSNIQMYLQHLFSNVGAGPGYMSIELRADTCNEAVFCVYPSNDIKFTGLSTSVWNTYTWQYTIPSTGNLIFFLGWGPTLTQASGTIHIKKLHLYKSAAGISISSPLNCSDDIICSQIIYATSFTSTSDETIKENVKDASIEDCMEIFQKVDVKTYTRNDGVVGSRIGFIAQDINDLISEESKLQNLVNPIFKDGATLLGIDYARLGSTVLWGVCKEQQAQIADLNARVKLLESKKRKT